MIAEMLWLPFAIMDEQERLAIRLEGTDGEEKCEYTKTKEGIREILKSSGAGISRFDIGGSEFTKPSDMIEDVEQYFLAAADCSGGAFGGNVDDFTYKVKKRGENDWELHLKKQGKDSLLSGTLRTCAEGFADMCSAGNP